MMDALLQFSLLMLIIGIAIGMSIMWFTVMFLDLRETKRYYKERDEWWKNR